MRFSVALLLAVALAAACSNPIAEPAPSGADSPPPLLPLPLNDRIVFWREGTIATVRSDGSDKRVLRSGVNLKCPRLSPDGNLISFISQSASGADTVWIMAANGTDARPILNFRGSFCPVWSPDGSKLAAIDDASMSVNRNVLMLSRDGNQLATFVASDFIGFSPDGSRILITRSEVQGAIISARWDGSNQTTIATGGRADWGNPDRIIYECTNGICSVSPDGSNQRQIFTNTTGTPLILITLAGAAPRISPDGKTVAFACTTTTFQGTCLLDVAAGTAEALPRITSAGAVPNTFPYQIVWSADSRTFATTCQFQTGGGKSVTIWTDLCIVDRDSKISRNLFSDSEWDQDPTLSPH